MASRLYQYLVDIYDPHRKRSPLNGHECEPIQVDDQNDDDNIERFCTVFVTVNRTDRLLVEIEGAIPGCEELWRFAESNGAHTDRKAGRIAFQITPAATWVLTDLAKRLRKCSDDEMSVLFNPDWPTVAQRTAASLERLAYAVRQFRLIVCNPNENSNNE